MKRYRLYLLGVLICLFVTACKVELYTNLDEREANEMMAVLLQHGIECSKSPGKENRWSLLVEKSSIAEALEILRREGLPRGKFVSLGEMFQKKGLVSSPLEERIRYIYALSQELSHTISLIDGVIAARVHIVLPENDPFTEKVQPSSAAVFIKYKPDTDITTLVPKIKKLVVNSIEELSYEKVTVVPFVSMEEARPKKTPVVRVMGIKLYPDSKGRFYMLIFGLILFNVVLAGFIGYREIYPRLREKKVGDQVPAEKQS